MVAYELLGCCLASVWQLIDLVPDAKRMVDEGCDTDLVCEILADADLSGVGIQDDDVVGSGEILIGESIGFEQLAC